MAEGNEVVITSAYAHQGGSGGGSSSQSEIGSSTAMMDVDSMTTQVR